VQILPANPRRFAIIFTYLNNTSPPDAHENFAFLNINANPIQFGIELPANQPFHLDYPKFAVLVQQPFFMRDSGANVSAPGFVSWIEVVQTANQ